MPLTNTTAHGQAPGAHAQAAAFLAEHSAAATAPGTAASLPFGDLRPRFQDHPAATAPNTNEIAVAVAAYLMQQQSSGNLGGAGTIAPAAAPATAAPAPPQRPQDHPAATVPDTNELAAAVAAYLAQQQSSGNFGGAGTSAPAAAPATVAPAPPQRPSFFPEELGPYIPGANAHLGAVVSGLPGKNVKPRPALASFNDEHLKAACPTPTAYKAASRAIGESLIAAGYCSEPEYEAFQAFMDSQIEHFDFSDERSMMAYLDTDRQIRTLVASKAVRFGAVGGALGHDIASRALSALNHAQLKASMELGSRQLLQQYAAQQQPQQQQQPFPPHTLPQYAARPQPYASQSQTYLAQPQQYAAPPLLQPQQYTPQPPAQGY
jgi:hypothetical protein